LLENVMVGFFGCVVGCGWVWENPAIPGQYHVAVIWQRAELGSKRVVLGGVAIRDWKRIKDTRTTNKTTNKRDKCLVIVMFVV
jgi:hypothetical protein